MVSSEDSSGDGDPLSETGDEEQLPYLVGDWKLQEPHGDELSIWDLLVQKGLLGCRTRKAYEHVILAWPSLWWLLATSGICACAATRSAIYYPKFYPANICRVLYGLASFAALCGVGLIWGSARILQSEAFKAVLQEFPRSNFDTNRCDAFRTWPACSFSVGKFLDCDRGNTLFYVIKAIIWYLVVAIPLGILPPGQAYKHRAYLCWIFTGASIGFLDVAWNFGMQMCEIASNDVVWHVWDTVKYGPRRHEDRDRFWLIVTDMHKGMDRQLRLLWHSAAVLYGFFFLALATLVLMSVLLGICLVRLVLIGHREADPDVQRIACAVLGIAVYAALRLFQKVRDVSSITAKCMSKSVLDDSIYSAAVQKCGTGLRGMSEIDVLDHKDFLHYLDRNPTGVIMGTLIDTRFAVKTGISLLTVFVSLVSYMVALVGLRETST